MTYSISTAGSINEGQRLSTTLSQPGSGDGVAPLYWSVSGSGIDSSDFSEGSLQSWDDDGAYTIFHTLANDNKIEGNEVLTFTAYTDSGRTNAVASASVTINDTSAPAPSYSLSTSTSSINEGSTFSSTATTNVLSGTTLYWSASGSNITSSDFSSGGLTGSGSVGSDGTFTFSHTLANDETTEGSETVNIKLFSDSSRSTQVGSTQAVTIGDTSLTPSLNATSGDDSFISTSSNDLINGGLGVDTVSFSGSFSDYSFVRGSDSLQITDLRSGTNNGVDTLKNIELVQFSDQLVDESKVDIVKAYSGYFYDYIFYNKGNGKYDIKTGSGFDEITGYPKLTFADKTISAITDIKGTFDQVTGLNTDSGQMFRLYNAAFKRLPDPDGLKYWIDKFSSGTDDSRAVASSFLASDEFRQRYGEDVTNAKYVETLYVNVLGRDYDQEGYNYWLGNLNNGIETRYELLLGFAESAENKTLFSEMTGFT